MTKNILNFFDNFDAKHPEIAGLYYMVIAGILFGILFFFYRFSMNHIPPIQLIFVVWLVIFLMNYYSMRDASITPFIPEITGKSMTAKLAGVFGFAAIVCINYSLQYIAIESALAIFFCAGIFGYIIEKVKNGSSFSGLELLFSLIMLGGVMFILRPPFLFGGLGEEHRIGHWNQTAPIETHGI